MARTTIRTEDVTDSEVTTAKMATDPTNATNLASGTVADARLGTIPADITANQTGITANQDDIALLGFKVAANGSLARYNLVDQSIDAFEDTSGVDASASTDEVRDASNYYSGELAGAATGGTVSTHTTFTVHKFPYSASGTSFVATGDASCNILVIAGGGSGAGWYDRGMGGGGAGGYRTWTGQSLNGSYTVTVGAGSTAPTSPAGTEIAGTQGGNSSVILSGPGTAFSQTSAGGGGGGAWAGVGTDGGSGGGRGLGAPATSGNTPATSPAQGYDGGGGAESHPSWYAGGGGGGAGGAGATGTSGGGGAGGVGIENDWETGSNQWYGGGGGGGGRSVPAGAAGTPNSGTGGAGGAGGDATDGFGGGGGSGASDPGTGGDGGDGVVLFRYTTGSIGDIYNDMTLVSNALTAESAPTTGDLVMTISNGAGTTTPNTDIKAYITRDGSDYTTAVTLVDQGDTGGHTILTANGVDLSGETSGTSMRWKIETLNQSVSKTTRIQAVSLGWS